MDILDAVTIWLEQKRDSGTHRIYLNQTSKTQLSTFLGLTRDEDKLKVWLTESNKNASNESLSTTNPSPIAKTPAEPIQTQVDDVIEKLGSKNTEIMANGPKKVPALPVTDGFTAIIDTKNPQTQRQTEKMERAIETEATHSDYIFLKQLSQQTKILIIGEQLYSSQLTHPFEKSKELLQDMIKAMDLFIKKNTTKEINIPWETISLVEVCKKSYKDQENLTYVRGQLSQIISVVQPEVILLMGALPTEALTETKSSVLNIHGQWFNFQNVACMPTFHPDFLNRAVSRKKEAWADLQKVIKFLLDRSV